MKRGYARVSTRRQDLALQLDALKKAGCEKIYTDKKSGVRAERKEFDRCLSDLEPGDVLVVYSLSRAGRSMRHLLDLIEDLATREVTFESLHEHIETYTATGRLIFHILAALSEFERELTIERIRDGIAAAKARGHVVGRVSVITRERTSVIKDMLASGMSMSQIARVTGISRATLYRHQARFAA